MNDMLLKLYVKFQDLKSNEEGQDLVEYALLVALLSLAAVAGLSTLSGSINGLFVKIENALGKAA